jgi:O-glycosyl hydrolase
VFWVTGQYSRFVLPGSVRVAAEPAGGSILTSAFVRPDGRLAIITVNTSGKDMRRTFSLSNAELVGETVEATRSSEGEMNVTLPPIPAEPTGFEATLRPLSVTTFVVSIG